MFFCFSETIACPTAYHFHISHFFMNESKIFRELNICFETSEYDDGCPVVHKNIKLPKIHVNNVRIKRYQGDNTRPKLDCSWVFSMRNAGNFSIFRKCEYLFAEKRKNGTITIHEKITRYSWRVFRESTSFNLLFIRFSSTWIKISTIFTHFQYYLMWQKWKER